MGRKIASKAVLEFAPSRKSRTPRKAELDISVVVPIQPQTKKTFHLKDLKKVSPLSENQALVFEEWQRGQNVGLIGYAGTGKTWCALYLALQTILDPETPQNKIIICKTPQQQVVVGHLPGTLEEKTEPFETPYREILANLFPWGRSYDNMKELGLIEYEPMVAVRGRTFDNAIVIVDELQNISETDIETIITRSGKNTRVMLCGDDLQNDLGKDSGFSRALPVLRRMKSVSIIAFKLDDIVRGGLAKEYLIAKYQR